MMRQKMVWGRIFCKAVHLHLHLRGCREPLEDLNVITPDQVDPEEGM